MKRSSSIASASHQTDASGTLHDRLKLRMDNSPSQSLHDTPSWQSNNNADLSEEPSSSLSNVRNFWQEFESQQNPFNVASEGGEECRGIAMSTSSTIPSQVPNQGANQASNSTVPSSGTIWQRRLNSKQRLLEILPSGDSTSVGLNYGQDVALSNAATTNRTISQSSLAKIDGTQFASSLDLLHKADFSNLAYMNALMSQTSAHNLDANQSNHKASEDQITMPSHGIDPSMFKSSHSVQSILQTTQYSCDTSTSGRTSASASGFQPESSMTSITISTSPELNSSPHMGEDHDDNEESSEDGKVYGDESQSSTLHKSHSQDRSSVVNKPRLYGAALASSSHHTYPAKGIINKIVVKKGADVEENMHEDDDDGGETRHLCPQPGCDKHFSTSGHARRHSRIHASLRPFECPHPGCGATFNRRDNCTSHQRARHKEFLQAHRIQDNPAQHSQN